MPEFDRSILGRFPLKLVGLKQVLRGISDGTLRCVIVSSDAEPNIRNQVAALAAAKGIDVYRIDRKAELGKLFGISVSAACAGLGEAKAKG